jgi:hypothetical protein
MSVPSRWRGIKVVPREITLSSLNRRESFLLGTRRYTEDHGVTRSFFRNAELRRGPQSYAEINSSLFFSVNLCDSSANLRVTAFLLGTQRCAEDRGVTRRKAFFSVFLRELLRLLRDSLRNIFELF